MVYRKFKKHIENSAKGSKMFFSFRSTPRKHWQLRGSRRARAVTRTERLCVRGSKWRQSVCA